MYERLIRDIKKTLYKTLGRSTLVLSQLETVVMDVERQLNNRPLKYVESEGGDGQVLTPNTVMWGENAHTLENTEADEDVLIRADKQLKLKRQHVWQRWRSEYIHSLTEQHRMNKIPADYPDVGEVVFVVGDEKNKAEWRKAKVVRHVRGGDGVVRGVVLLSRGHHIERPLNLVCPLEIRSSKGADEEPQASKDVQRRAPSERRAAKEAQRNKEQLSELEEL